MSVEKIREVLGRLQENPESDAAWDELTEIVASVSENDQTDVSRLLEAARARHEQRRDFASVARILEMELLLLDSGTDAASKQGDLARIYDEQLFDSKAATSAYERLSRMSTDPKLVDKASEFLENEAPRAAKRDELVARYTSEAEGATDSGFKSRLHASAADVVYRFGGDAAAAAPHVDAALAADPKNRKAVDLAEVIYGKLGRHEELAAVFARLLAAGASRDDRLSAGLKVGRLYARFLDKHDLAIDAYQKVLDMVPGQPDALEYLADAYSKKEEWDHLVALYEDQLRGGLKGDAELGALLQIAMVHWRMRDKPEAAEPYFDRVRRLDPTHAGMLNYFREMGEKRGDTARLIAVLTEAQRHTTDPAAKKELAREIARRAESQDNSSKAIEQYKALLRGDPDNVEARDALRRLYQQAGSYAPLAELYRHDLEKATSVEEKRAILGELTSIHRDKQRNEPALLGALGQLAQLEPVDIAVLKELADLHEHLGRYRDLLTVQQKLAEITPDAEDKANLYRSIARRWLDQFSNVQNGIAAYEALLVVVPRDDEARQKLRDLYNKRRSFAQLYALYEHELGFTEGADKVALKIQMAKLASERLDKAKESITLLREVLAEEPDNAPVFDLLEKQTEREKDFVTLAEVLEQRHDVLGDDAQKLVLLQKLGSIYETRLKDPAATTRTYRRILAISPGHAKSLRVLREAYLEAQDLDALEELYGSQNDWENLADFLSSAADKATAEQKVAISFRAARVYEERLSSRERASRSYERVLSVDPKNTQAAAALIPTYEKEERWARLPSLYEILLGSLEPGEESRASRVELMRKLSQVSGGPLANKAQALVYARRAFEEDPSTQNLASLEAAARSAGNFAPFVEAIEARLGAADVDPSDRKALMLRLADAYARELGRLDQAITTYRDVVEADPSDTETMATFDALLRSAERKDDLRWLFELRVKSASDADRAAIYEEWATLEEDVFADPESAIRLYRQATSADPTHKEALRSLARLLLAKEDYSAAVSVLEQHRDLVDGDERAQLDIEIGALYQGRLDKPLEALQATERALGERPHDPDAVAILARLLDAAPARHRAATLLSAEYEGLGDWRRAAEATAVMMETETEPVTRLELHERLATIQAERLALAGPAFATTLRALNEFPREFPLWNRARDLARAAGVPTDLADAYRVHVLQSPWTGTDEESARVMPVERELCERAAHLHDQEMGDPDGALPYLKRILVLDPKNEKAFDRLRSLLVASERWAELEEVFERAIELAPTPEEKLSLLSEIALISEETIGDYPKAIAYHERLVAMSPEHTPSLDSLEKLYEDEERYTELATLLNRRLVSAEGDEAVDIRLYLGRLYFDQLQKPLDGFEQIEAILTERPSDPDARELAERMLENDELKLPVARLLESVYEAKDEVRALVSMLEIRLRATESEAERTLLLRRIAELRDERLHDDATAFEAMAELVPLDPEDKVMLTRFSAIGKRLGKQTEVANAIGNAAARTTDKALKAELLMLVASIADRELLDEKRAEENLEAAFAIEPEDPGIALPAAEKLAELHERRKDAKKLAAALERQAHLVDSAEARKDIYARLGSIYENDVSDRDAAVRAYRARLEDEPTDETALGRLEAIFDQSGDHKAQVEVLRSREAATTDATERRRVLTKAARLLAGPGGDVDAAISTWRTVRDAFGSDQETLDALSDLYERSSQSIELAETLEARLEITEDTKERVRLLERLGATRLKDLQDVDGALDVYREAVALDPADLASRKALEALIRPSPADLSALIDGTESANAAEQRAAEILRPLYETDANAERLLRVLEVEILSTDDIPTRLEALSKATHLADSTLGDKKRAFAYATLAAKLATADETLPEKLDAVERLAEVPGGGSVEALVELYKDLEERVVDERIRLRILLTTGKLAEEKLGDQELAIATFERARDVAPDDPRALSALERLFDRSGDAQKLLRTLRERADIADDAASRKELLFRCAEIEERAVGVDAAIGTLSSILDIEMDPRATSRLEDLYAKAGRASDLVALYERMLETSRDKAALRVKIAKISRSERDLARTFDELGAALESDANQPDAVAELEAILFGAGDVPREDTAEDRARAAELLEPVYLRRADWSGVRKALDARLEAADDAGSRIELLRRLSTLHEEQLEDYGAALETYAKILHEDVEDETTWSELERLARVSSQTQRLATIYAGELEGVDSDDPQTAKLAKRTAELFEDHGDLDRALSWFRRAHAFEPESVELFDAVDRILSRREAHAERAELYRRGVEYREGEARVALYHRLADIEERDLGEPEKAILTYKLAIDQDPSDETSLDRLTVLYRSQSRFTDLAELYRRRADDAETAERGAPHRLALARLLRTELSDVPAAIDELRTVVEQLPWNEEAVAELEALGEDDAHKAAVIEILGPIYERSDDYKKQIKLNEDKVRIETDPRDKATVLLDSARLYEQRGNDPGAAFDVARRAFELDPTSSEVRERLEELAATTERYGELAAAFDAAKGGIGDDIDKREVLLALARVYDTKIDDPRSALATYAELSKIDPDEPSYLDTIDELCMLLGDWPRLVDVLLKKCERASDPEAARHRRRIAEIKLDMLEDPRGAIAEYEEGLKLEPGHKFTMDRLIELYEANDAPERLVELYAERVEGFGADEAEERFDLNTRAAKLYEESLSRPDLAIQHYRAALDDKASDAATLSALERLFRTEKQWDELLDNLRQQASVAETAAARNEKRNATAEVLFVELERPEEALDEVRRVLEEDPTSDVALDLAKRIATESEMLRVEAADVALPVLRSRERHREVVELLELKLTGTEPGSEQATLLKEVAAVEDKLGETGRAENALLRALAEAPDDAEIHDRLLDVGNRASDRREALGRYADALEARGKDELDAVLAKGLYVRLAELSEARLEDDARAARAYAKAFELDEGDAALLEGLDRLYTRLQDDKALADVLARRIDVAPREDQSNLHYRLAKLQIEKQREPQKGLTSLASALEADVENREASALMETLTDNPALFEEAGQVLEGVYRQRGDNAGLAKVYEKRIKYAPTVSERVRMRLDLSRVLEERGADQREALTVLLGALEDDPADADVLGEIERLAEATGEFARAADAAEKAARDALDLSSDTATDLWIRIAGWRRDKVSDDPGAERALKEAAKLDPENTAILRQLEILQRAEARERDLIGTLRALAKLETDETGRELRKEAMELASRIGDAELAESILRELIAVDDTDSWALAELTTLREKAADHAEVFKLLTRQGELLADASAIRDVRLKAARVAEEKLGEDERAIDLYQQMFEEDVRDREAADALARLYGKLGRKKDALALLERLIDAADDATERGRLRVEAAKVSIELDSTTDAIDLLSAVLEEDPGNAEAAETLRALYESTGRDAELAELVRRRIDHFKSTDSTELEIKERLRLADILVTRLGDADGAIDAYGSVVELQPENTDALRSLATLQEKQGRKAESASTWGRLVSSVPPPEGAKISLHLAELFAGLGDVEAEREGLERGLTLSREDRELRNKLKNLYERTGSHKNLAQLLADDADLTPEVGQKVALLRQAAELHAKQLGDEATAADLLARAAELVPNDRELLLLLCDAYSASGRGKRAVEVLEKVVESFGGRRSKELGPIHHRLAKAHLAEGDKVRALAELDAAFKLDPGSIVVLRDLGVLSLELSEEDPGQRAPYLDRALKTFKALLLQRLDQDTPITKPQVFYYLGEVYHRQGDDKQAIISLQRAIDTDKTLETARTLLAKIKG